MILRPDSIPSLPGVALLALGLLFFSGCSADSSSENQDDNQQGPRIAHRSTRPSPHGEMIAEDRVKPGHWSTISSTLRSNQNDLRGDLKGEVRTQRTSDKFSNVGEQSRETLTSRLRTSRPIVLPKGQSRSMDVRVLPPMPSRGGTASSAIQCKVIGNDGSVYNFDSGPIRAVAPEEYFFVVLTERNNRFKNWALADWAVHPQISAESNRPQRNYSLVIPPTSGVLPLADTVLDWTSTAVLLWDDLEGAALTPDQFKAIEDWLHFGGRLIVNGADAADELEETILADYLPIEATGNIELDTGAAESLLNYWSIDKDSTTPKQIAILKAEENRVSLDGKLHPDASDVEGTGGLIAQRQVGRGMVIQSRIDLTTDFLRDWRSMQGFFNAAVLNRPARRYIKAASGFDPLSETLDPYSLIYEEGKQPRATASQNTDFRFLSRDGYLVDFKAEVKDEKSEGEKAYATLSRSQVANFGNQAGSIGAWNPNSNFVANSQASLKDASGIEIPKSTLVVKSLGYYLLALIPLNYLVFRLMGKVEYAWLAIPFIAIGGAVFVARAARLDIGFARSLNEIALLEVPAGHHRGHLSRVAAIYNSLSDRYDVQFATLDAVAAPIHPGGKEDEIRADFRTSFGDGPAMQGLPISSNQVRMFQAEEMVDVGGKIRIVKEQLVNDSELELEDAFLVRRSESGIESVVIGLIEAESAVDASDWRNSEPSIPGSLELGSDRLMRALAMNLPIGVTRLVGRVDGSLGSMSIDPMPVQGKRQTVVSVDLTPATPRKLQKDVTLPPEPATSISLGDLLPDN